MNREILAALKDIGVPVRFQSYGGKEESYITFFTYLDKPELHSDDRELVTGNYIQIDVWSKKDYTKLVDSVHQNMIEANFSKLNFYDLYEDELKVYHKVMRFFKEEI